MKLLLGTTNLNKIADYQKFLRHAEFELITLPEIDFFDEPLEIGRSFKENALQKARFYAERTELPALADDGGFEVDFLDGRPGIESNRWMGPNANGKDKIDRVLELLRGVPLKQRSARLKTVIVVYFPHEQDYAMVQGGIEGFVAKEPGRKIIAGFPYRSILYLPEYNKCYSDLTDEEIFYLDHRRLACKELLLKLEPWLRS